MRGFLVACIIVCAPSVASAQVALHGWTDDGRFVVEVSDGIGAWGAEWMSGAEDTSDFWGVCTPQSPSSAANFGDGACQLCKDADSCGLTVDGSKVKPAKKSPNKKIKLTDKRKCVKNPDEITHKSCSRTIGFGKAGKLVYDEAWSGDKAPMHVYFRKDSKAALVVFDTSGRMDGVTWPSMYVVDLGGGAAGGASYDIALTDLSTQQESEPTDDDPVGTSTGTANVVLKVTEGGKTRTVPLDTLELYSHGAYGLGDALTFGKDLRPSLGEDLSSDTADAVKAHLPAGTVKAVGFVNWGERGTYKFVVYAVAKGSVTRQTWSEGSTEPDDENTVKF